MSDLAYMIGLTAIIGGGMIVIAGLEWIDREPKDWVVKVRMWWNRGKR